MNFASDNWAGVLPSVMDAVVRGNSGFAPAYGSDDATARTAALFRDTFETDLDLHFVATGTAANALCMAALARPGGIVFCSAVAHVHVDEFGATEFMTGMKLVPVPAPDGRITPQAFEAALARYPEGGHSGPPVALTLTNATESGTVYTPEDVAALARVAKGRGMAVHLDGARFGNAVAAGGGGTPAELSWKAGVDIMSFGATKNGAMGAEAIVVFNRALGRDLAALRQRAGHVVSKARFVAAQFDGYFEGGAWLEAAAHANRMAALLRAGLSASDRARLAWDSQANEVFAILPATTIARLLAAGATFHPWLTEDDAGPDAQCVRLVTSFATTEAEVGRFLDLL